MLLIALYVCSNTLNLYIEHIRLSNPLLFNGNNAESDFWTITIASSHSLPINVHTTTYMVTGSHTPTSYRIHMRSMPAVYNMFQALFSLLFQTDNSRKLRSRGLSEDSASWDAGCPFFVIILRRGWSRFDGRQRDAGSGGRVVWLMMCISTRGTPRRWLHLE